MHQDQRSLAAIEDKNRAKEYRRVDEVWRWTLTEGRRCVFHQCYSKPSQNFAAAPFSLLLAEATTSQATFSTTGYWRVQSFAFSEPARSRGESTARGASANTFRCLNAAESGSNHAGHVTNSDHAPRERAKRAGERWRNDRSDWRTRTEEKRRGNEPEQKTRWDLEMLQRAFRASLSPSWPRHVQLTTDETGGHICLIFPKLIISTHTNDAAAVYLSVSAFLGGQCRLQIYWRFLTYAGWKPFQLNDLQLSLHGVKQDVILLWSL